MAETVAWFHCFSGIAGDMAFGALVDAGADLHEVEGILGRLPVGGWTVQAEPTLRGGIAGTRIVVGTEDTTVVRTYAHITGLLAEARLPDRVRERAQATFPAIARVEARLHRRPIEQVHFHEVGALDAIVDVVGVAACLEVLDVDTVTASSVATGTGMVRTSHGLLPVPAPATTALLAEANAPTHGIDVRFELTTPTGAGLLTALASRWGVMPSMHVTASGFGAGTRELELLPNLTQVVIGTAEEAAATSGQPVMLLEANVDDATGETLAHAITALLDAGAHDAWVTPIVMKKGRPAHTVSALADPALARQVMEVLRTETGTLGVRGQTLERWPAPRTLGEVEVRGLPVRVKVGAGRVKVEHDDAAKAARRTGLPLREVVSLAEEAWRRRGEGATVVELPTPDDTPPGGDTA